MTTIAQADFIQSIADALQHISYFHPLDYIHALGDAYEKEQSPAAKDAIANATAVSGTTGEVLPALQQRRKEEAELFASMGMNPGGGSAEPEEKA
jgi:fumarate hydratase class I